VDRETKEGREANLGLDLRLSRENRCNMQGLTNLLNVKCVRSLILEDVLEMDLGVLLVRGKDTWLEIIPE
jgi:hypothetical protein